jgi:uncharacterized protein YjiS (DUF1127 family)
MNAISFVTCSVNPRMAARHPAAGPGREGPLARLLRRAEDHANLAELDDHRLRDLGLTRTDVALGVPFRRAGKAAPPAMVPPHDMRAPVQAGPRCIGIPGAWAWRWKHHAPAAESPGLVPDAGQSRPSARRAADCA